MNRQRTFAAALALALFVAPIAEAAQTTRTLGGSRATTVVGTAWNADTKPLPNASIRLRNVSTGKVEATATTNQLGEFMFQGVSGGTFMTELVDNGGTVLAAGETFTINPGDTVVTFVRLRPRSGGLFGGLWGNAALAAIAAAAGLGITAAEPCQCGALSPEG
jgi:hypothetical protein